MDKSKHVTADMRRSMDRVEAAKPIILGLLNGDEIMCVEGSDNEVLRMLDMTCGIDYYHVFEKYGLVRGVASRFQTIRRGCKPFNTFTVRKERESGAMTEFEKRKKAIEHGGEYPYLTMQAYVDGADESILSLGIARTKDIIESIEMGLAKVRHTGCDQIGQAYFYVIPWDVMRDSGYTVLSYPDKE